MQQPFPRATKLRAVLLTGAMAGVTALAFAGGNWAGTVWAQTIPSLTPIPPATQVPHPSGGQATAEPTSTPAPELTPLPAVTEPPFTISAPAPVTGTTTLDVGIGTVTFAPADGVTSVTAETVAAGDLAEPPAGWQRLTPGLRVGALASQSRPVFYFSRGYSVCLNLPAVAAGFRELRIGYYDASPSVKRWVLLMTEVTASQACTAGFRLAATFALFGRTGVQAPAVSEQPLTPSVPAAVTQTATLDAGIGIVTARLGGGIASVTADTVAAGDLAEPPAGWQLLTPGLRVEGLDSQSSPDLYFSRGYSVCLNLPAGVAGFRQLRIGYYDAFPRINRWVLLMTDVTANEACTAGFRQAATFALLGR
jgi:hypothetical protein